MTGHAACANRPRMTKSFEVAVLGATGAVGKEMLAVLAERRFPVKNVRALASPRSAGASVAFGATSLRVEPVSREAFEGVDVALFSAGSGPSKEWAPVAAAAGALVVDNSSAWRMDPDVPLCVPEANLEAARRPPKGIVANPNCSTIQMVVALKPIHDQARLRRIVVSTYQAISGAGAQAAAHFDEQVRALAHREGRAHARGTDPQDPRGLPPHGVEARRDDGLPGGGAEDDPRDAEDPR
jgi:aspartate-semialdehyde dehydrogenase